MKLAYFHSHHYGAEEWKRRELFDWICNACDSPGLKIRDTKNVQEHFRDVLTLAGWSGPARISVDSNLSIFSLKADLAFQVQLGNISRCAYDLLKIQYMYQSGKINMAALAVPTNSASKELGSNSANSNRVWNELQIFNRVITVPILLLAVE
ncbi:hypothetical protein J7E73_07940 [Paenibacillus albidus]|uniref:BglII/BstYI family type II restriction endonuclease n=1 Tax=Paenibacillus albidus TaxID=2041023 RepID=UPI001BEBFFC3|nr:BglII/BstYI family type II restriction endonuclease [Paenibacillus albidus]MBT2289065.1 hypothetical protein [Paenibacillus albidus]